MKYKGKGRQKGSKWELEQNRIQSKKNGRKKTGLEESGKERKYYCRNLQNLIKSSL